MVLYIIYGIVILARMVYNQTKWIKYKPHGIQAIQSNSNNGINSFQYWIAYYFIIAFCCGSAIGKMAY